MSLLYKQCSLNKQGLGWGHDSGNQFFNAEIGSPWVMGGNRIMSPVELRSGAVTICGVNGLFAGATLRPQSAPCNKVKLKR